ncbi:MAG: hypothetical protein MK212_02035 [Saprospiraceae bacterium]|nr:hypothetical protein [Saprospiraceae bacterium]
MQWTQKITVLFICGIFLLPICSNAQQAKQYRDTLEVNWPNGNPRTYQEGILYIYENGDSSLKKSGLQIRWYENGQMASKGNYFLTHDTSYAVGDVYEGWYEDGTPKTIRIYKEMDTLFLEPNNADNYVLLARKVNIKRFYENGELKETHTWRKGRCKRAIKTYYDKGSVLVRLWKREKGYCCCEILKYYENGKIKEKGQLSPNYKYGGSPSEYPKMGKWIYYDENGKRTKIERHSVSFDLEKDE